jgi:group I intron endonuclease
MIVYLVTNKHNGKQYVGQTVKPLQTRWAQHGNDTSHVSLLRNALKKYGTNSFVIEIIHECLHKEEMDFVEIFYISFLNTKSPNGYNLTDGGEGSLGHTPTKEARVKMSLAKKGLLPPKPIKRGQRLSPSTEIKKGQRLSPSTEFKAGFIPWNKGKSHLKGALNPFYHKKHSPEALQKMRLAKLGRKQSPEHVAKRMASILKRKELDGSR